MKKACEHSVLCDVDIGLFIFSGRGRLAALGLFLTGPGFETVSFSERRSGLMKKASELSVLCGVDIDLFIFHGCGLLHEFCSGDCIFVKEKVRKGKRLTVRCCDVLLFEDFEGIKLSTRGLSILTFNQPMPEANAQHNWNMDGPTGRGTGAETPLQNYTIGKTLGHGSFGKVKIAEHRLTGYKVAIKILNCRKMKSHNMEEKVRREIKICRLFVHPHIIRLYEVIETSTDIYVVMEYVKSGELFDYIVEKRILQEDEARSFF
ncbi:hypothetical protein RHMOL_Rhmol12G0108500 [Rhododendron molle]|uniref:Uncharacterized protein n=1 Tax=Rhododendron molle TaxID=49168 RepID=A0ACC0LHN8_RHOML|nr:hypothetical protein RHMOL_Rhmol12G0108500 [Rhododendron molle]